MNLVKKILNLSLEGRVALVTGASRGIGKAIALALAESGATVIGTATTTAGADNISAYLHEVSAKGAGMLLNVTQADTIEAVLQEIEQKFGAPTILINNAGITRDNLLLRMKDDEWQAVIDTNLTAIYHLSKRCIRAMMKNKWGRIINISSVVGSMGNPGQANYAAAKAAIMGFSKSLAQEIGSRNITVNVIAPGFIDTDMTRELPESQKQALLDHIPLQRLGDPNEIAAAVAFLASEAAGYITGHTLHINGGMYMG
ncbi:MAG: 3-oxoacyl-(acyl-carrier protein) reductase [Gammaproteobacteria bacterium]|nr:3-oxoacyl-(acyl-carrier protein) reductase [Gammaproteobacteria bacterium]